MKLIIGLISEHLTKYFTAKYVILKYSNGFRFSIACIERISAEFIVIVVGKDFFRFCDCLHNVRIYDM